MKLLSGPPQVHWPWSHRPARAGAPRAFRSKVTRTSMPKSLVSVMIPMRNAERFVGSTLQSVLDQQDVELEIVIVDDGSTDRSLQIVSDIEDHRIRTVPGPRSGIAAAFNAGLEAAAGSLFVRCDADDLFPPGRLAWQVRFLEEHPEFGAVCGSYQHVSESGKLVIDHTVGTAGVEVTDELRRGIGRSHLGAYAIRTDILRRLGGCRTYFVTSEDADLQYRLGEATRVWYEPRVSYLYRLHDASITHSRRTAERLFFEQAARVFQEQRRMTGKDDLERGCAAPPPLAAAADENTTASSAHIQDLLLRYAWEAHRGGHKAKAIWTGMRACLTAPLRTSAWKSLGALAMKRAGQEGKQCA